MLFLAALFSVSRGEEGRVSEHYHSLARSATDKIAIITVEGAFRSADQGFEEAAATLGAKRMTVFRRITVPMIAPSLGAGAVLCWARALGEFGATITFAGSFPGQTETMPIAVYYALENDPDAAIALSLVLLLVSVAVLVSLRDRWVRGSPL